MHHVKKISISPTPDNQTSGTVSSQAHVTPTVSCYYFFYLWLAKSKQQLLTSCTFFSWDHKHEVILTASKCNNSWIRIPAEIPFTGSPTCLLCHHITDCCELKTIALASLIALNYSWNSIIHTLKYTFTDHKFHETYMSSLLKLKCNVFGKSKVLPVTCHATQRGNRAISLLSPNLGTGWGWVANNFFGTE
jgi:hypothetical protein